MIGFGIDKIQAEFVAEIKLRHLNREYILKRLEDIDRLKKDVTDMEDILSSKSRVKKIIISELNVASDKYGKDRRSEILYPTDEEDEETEEPVSDYPVTLFFTRDGYFKKIRMLPRLTSDCEDECEDILIYCSVNVHIIFAATT